MHLVLAAGTVPHPGTNGPAVSLWSLVTEALTRGHQITVLVLHWPSAHGDPAPTGPVEALGARVEVVDARRWMQPGERSRLARAVRPTAEDLYPWSRMAEKAGGFLDGLSPDVILAYETRVAAAVSRAHAPVIAMTVDLDHLPGWLRFKGGPRPGLRAAVRALHDRFWRPRRMVEILRGCDAVINHAAHHAAWLQAEGVDCAYLPMPVPDPGPRVKRSSSHGALRVLMLGHMKGTATLAGLELFATSVLPCLRERSPEGTTIRIAGAFPESLPPRVAHAFEGADVELLGYVEDIGDEFDGCDVVLVPTPVELGTRVRVLVAFSYGCCVVAHEANARGIPELVPETNVLLAPDGEGLCEALVRSAGDPSLRTRLASAGRETFERSFSPSAAAGRILEMAEVVPSGTGLSAERGQDSGRLGSGETSRLE